MGGVRYRIAGNFRAVQNFAFFVDGCRPAKIKTAKSFCNAHAHGQVCIYLMMDGHKHHAVAVGERCFSVVSIYFDLYCEQPLRPPSLSSHRKCEVNVCAIVIVF